MRNKTQAPCLLTMDIITIQNLMNEREFLSYKAFVQDLLDGWRPPLGLEVIETKKMKCWHCNTKLIWGGDHDI